MESLPNSVVENDDVATAARFILLCKKGDATSAATFLRRTLAEVDGSALDFGALTSTLGYEFMGADIRAFGEAAPHVNGGFGFEFNGDVDGPRPGRDGLVPIRLAGDDIDRQQATLLMLIPGDIHIVGHLIGKGGLEIGKIEAESGASVKIDSQSHVYSSSPILAIPGGNIVQINERVVTITGTITACLKAQRMLDRRLRARLESDGIHREVLRIVVPNDFVRHLIGKSGSNISMLQSQTKIRIQVQAESNMALGQLGRVVTFQGAEHGRALAQYLVSRQLADGPFRDWPAQQPSSPSVVARIASSPLPETPTLGGFSDTPYNGVLSLSSHMPAISEQIQIQPFSSLPEPSPRQHFEPFHDDSSDPNHSIQLAVPSSSVAFLIGKGGSAVSEIETKSGARVRIAKQTQGDPNRVVSIKGSASSVLSAQVLVNSRIEAYMQTQHHHQ